MKKAVSIFICAALLAATCGCSTPEPSPSPAAAEETPEAALAEGEYVVNSAITVDGGKKLSLILHGEKQENGLFGITKIDVLDGEALLQTIEAKEAIEAEWGDADQSGATQAHEENGGLTVDDMNFDGSGDVGLVGWVTAGANVPYYYWLWNVAAQRFEYAFCLCNASADNDAKQIVTYERVGAGCYVTDRYKYAADGSLVLAMREIETEGERSAAFDELTALLSDISENYHPGTAGCSLSAAKYAGMLLDINAEYASEFEQAGVAANEFYYSLNEAERETFTVQLGDVYKTALLLAKGESADLIETAGFAPQFAPWDEDSATLFFSGLYWGMGLEAPAE